MYGEFLVRQSKRRNIRHGGKQTTGSDYDGTHSVVGLNKLDLQKSTIPVKRISIQVIAGYEKTEFAWLLRGCLQKDFKIQNNDMKDIMFKVPSLTK